jgi:predicted CopG family antitoxin
MKRKLTLTIDEDIYRGLEELPRKVSVSELVGWVLKAMIEDVKKGRELTKEEFDAWIESTPEGRDFRERFIEKYGYMLNRLKYGLNAVKKVKGGKGK